MLRVTAADSNFFVMVSYVQKPTEAMEEVIQAIQAFRAKLSLKWYQQFVNQDPEACLASVWVTLFTLVKDDDSGIRIAAYSAIGALLFALTPFAGSVIQSSFSKAVADIQEVIPRASIAIVTSFLFISQAISPVILDQFITSTPVLHHFGVDVSQFIQFMPKFIPLMGPLPLEFHQALLRSLLCAFGRSPNPGFVRCVKLLVSLNPERLMDDLMEFILSNSLNQTILALGPDLLDDPKNYALLESRLEKFIEVSLNVIHGQGILADFELACNTLAVLVKNCKGEFLLSLTKRIEENMLPSYPKHFERFLFQIPGKFEQLFISEEDSNSVRIAKIRALARFVESAEAGSDRMPTILKMFAGCIQQQGDVFTTLVDAVSSGFSKLIGVNDQIFANLLVQILDAKNLVWTQSVAVVKLLLAMGPDCKLVDGFHQIAFKKAMKFSLSDHDELRSIAMKGVTAFVELSAIPIILDFFCSIDIFDGQICLRGLDLLHAVLDVIHPSFLMPLADLVCETILFHNSDWQVAGQGFRFLFRCSVFDLGLNSCADWIIRMHRWIVQMDSVVQSLYKFDPLPPLLTTIETDIIASDIIAAKDQMIPLFYCYQYFVNCRNVPFQIKSQFAVELVKIFPGIVRETHRWLAHEKLDNYRTTVEWMLNNGSSARCCAMCCDFLGASGVQPSEQTMSTVKFWMKNKRVMVASIAYSFYRLFRDKSGDPERKWADLIESRLDRVNLTIFRIKCHTLAVEEFAAFLKEVPFAQWPLYDGDFIEWFMKTTDKFDVNWENCDDPHLRFVFHFKDRFAVDREGELEVSYRIRRLRFQERKDIVLFPVECDKRQSCISQLLKGKVECSESHICSFLRFSTVEINSETFVELVQQIKSPETAIAAIEFAKRSALQIRDSEIVRFLKMGDSKLTHKVALVEFVSAREDIFKLPFRAGDFLHEYRKGFIAKSRSLIELAALIAEAGFSAASIAEFVGELTVNISEVMSHKRLMAMLKVIEVTLLTYGRRLGEAFFQQLDNCLAKLEVIDVPGMYTCLSLILAKLFAMAPPNLLRLCESFDRIVPQSALFVIAEALALVKGPILCTRLAKSSLTDLFVIDLPSQKLRLLRAVDCLVTSPQQMPYYFAGFSQVMRVFSEDCDKPFFDRILANLASTTASSVRFDLVRPMFVQKILPLLFPEPNSPQFVEVSRAISVVTQALGPPIDGYSEFIDQMLVNCHPMAANYYCDFVQFLLRSDMNEDRRSDVTLQQIHVLQKIWGSFPTVENGERLLGALKQPYEGFEPGFMVLGKLAMLAVPCLAVLVLVKKYVKGSSNEEIAACKTWYGNLCDSYGDDVKAKCIGLILDGRSAEVIELLTAV
jgi:hypothetical protein